MKELMAKYGLLIKTYIKMYLQYPMGLFLKIIYLPIQMLMYIFLWKMISQYSDINLKYMVCYYLFSILLGYAFPFVHIASDIQNDVFDGRILNSLIRPVSYATPIIAKYVAWMICYFVIFIPALLFSVYYYEVGIINILFFVLYFFIGAIVEFLIWYNVGLLSLRTERIRGLIMAVMAVRTFASGSLIPLQYLPKLLKQTIQVLPFQLYIYQPVNTLLSGTNAKELISTVIMALLWIIALCMCAEVQWNVHLKKIQINVS